MGVASVLKRPALEVAHKLVSSEEDKFRRRGYQERFDLYHESAETILEEVVSKVFDEPAVRLRMKAMIPLAAAESLVRRVVDEVAGTAYQVDPVRRVKSEDGQTDDAATSSLRALADKVRLNEKNDKACRMAELMNHAFVFCRRGERLGPGLDVITPNHSSVVPDPDDPTLELGFIYDRVMMVDGKPQTVHVFWDDAESFAFDDAGHVVPLFYQATDKGLSPIIKLDRSNGHPGVLPIVAIHRRERVCGQYWDRTSGKSLIKGSVAIMLLSLLRLKLHKHQGEKQIVVQGDVHGFPKDQVIDGGGAILSPEGTSVSLLDLTTPAEHYTSTIDDIAKRIAASHGINLERLNAKAVADASETGLLERREDIIKMARRAEEREYEILKVVTGGTEDELPDGSYLVTDFGEVTLRSDPAGTLDLWERMEKRGLRNCLDDIRALNPEIETDEEAWEEFDQNLEVYSKKVEKLRALNMNSDGSIDMPGQDAKANGALGPMKRDGKITADQVDEMFGRRKYGGAAATTGGGEPPPDTEE